MPIFAKSRGFLLALPKIPLTDHNRRPSAADENIPKAEMSKVGRNKSSQFRHTVIVALSPELREALFRPTAASMFNRSSCKYLHVGIATILEILSRLWRVELCVGRDVPDGPIALAAVATGRSRPRTTGRNGTRFTCASRRCSPSGTA